jgi:four helix bundle protein
MKQSPIFVKTHDLLLWLLPQTAKFPREQRFALTQAVQQSAMRLQERLIEAGMAKGQERFARLREADVELVKLKAHLRLCQDMNLLTVNQYGHVSQMTLEVGKLLGAWLQQENRSQSNLPESSPLSGR